ncbi:hypothetical protein [Humibacillus xanthopallidus]|uniref:hypothetical protein n=1 Tax=Humibacillus xanthopallidus TaxID=412689 RepID=UPI00384C0539
MNSSNHTSVTDKLPLITGLGQRLTDVWVRGERDYDTWFAEDFDEGDADDWRRAGFTASEAAAWVGADATFGASSNGARITMASAWIVAGFSPEAASAWDDLLAHHDAAERPMLAREWVASGLSLGTARAWIEREDVTTAVILENNGWVPWQRDMLDVLLGLPGTDDPQRLELIASGFAPGHLLDYVRAGVDPREFGWWERLRRQGQDVDDLLCTMEGQREWSYDIAFRLDWILDSAAGSPAAPHLRRPSILGKPDPYAFHHEYQYGELSDLPGPKLIETWRENGGVPVRWGFDEWSTGGCPEDYAYEPRFDWTDEQEQGVREALEAVYGDEETSVVISWPPEGSLWTEGHASSSEAEGCFEHEEFRATCESCRPAPAHQVEMAEWHWYVDVDLITHLEDEERDEFMEHAHVLTSSIDPRCVEYSEVALR